MSNKQRMTQNQQAELDEYLREENEFFINDERNRQNEIMKQQDIELDKLHQNVQIVAKIGEEINKEIETQDPEEMKNIKKQLGDWTDYEVSFEYDEDGYIYYAIVEE